MPNAEIKSDRRDRFRRLAERRTQQILERLKVLGNCANRSSYDYTEEEIKKIFSVIETEVRSTKAKFTFPRGKKFKL